MGLAAALVPGILRYREVVVRLGDSDGCTLLHCVLGASELLFCNVQAQIAGVLEELRYRYYRLGQLDLQFSPARPVMVRPDGGSAANEIIVTGGHVGTHIDALAHVSHQGRLHGGVEPDEITSQLGFTSLGVETIDPIVCRGVILDIARLHGVDVVSPGHEVTPSELESAASDAGVEVREGDAVLIRTGWATLWDEPDRFLGVESGAPGPGEESARWLADRRVRVAGGETIAFEVVPPGAGHRTLPVHRVLLVEAGIYILEVMDLSAFADLSVREFLFFAAPLKLVGATGSPIRPLAIIHE